MGQKGELVIFLCQFRMRPGSRGAQRPKPNRVWAAKMGVKPPSGHCSEA